VVNQIKTQIQNHTHKPKLKPYRTDGQTHIHSLKPPIVL
jgi:hypothetical protein